MRARVAASGIREGVLGGASVRVAGGAVVVFLVGVFEAVELDGGGGGGGAAATFFLHPPAARHSVIAAETAKSLDFIREPSNIQDTKNRAALSIPSIGYFRSYLLSYHSHMRIFLATLICAAAALGGDKETLLKQMDSRATHYGEVSRKIWEFAEVGYKEYKSVDLLKSELRQAGFVIEDNVAGIPTAFTASWGQGKPVIAVLGEYDALPGLSQDTTPDRKPMAEGAPGHGCGHNLLGAASLFAVVSIKDWLASKKIPGTIRFYGTPAEEGGGGKLYMARAGVFKDVDAVLSWHPGDSNGASKQSSLAITSAKFKFYGKPAHAAAAPEVGRSALDGVMLMGNAVEFLREHVPESTRIHYVISNGGAAPNVVPEFAELFLYARHPSMPILDGIWNRIVKCAQAGALATETRMEMELIDSSYNVLPNDALAALVDRNLHQVGGVTYTKEEQAFAYLVQIAIHQCRQGIVWKHIVAAVDQLHLHARFGGQRPRLRAFHDSIPDPVQHWHAGIPGIKKQLREFRNHIWRSSAVRDYIMNSSSLGNVLPQKLNRVAH